VKYCIQSTYLSRAKREVLKCNPRVQSAQPPPWPYSLRDCSIGVCWEFSQADSAAAAKTSSKAPARRRMAAVLFSMANLRAWELVWTIPRYVAFTAAVIAGVASLFC